MQILGLLSDLLLIGATLGLAAWCRHLSARLRASDASPRVDPADLEGRVASLRQQIAQLEAATVGAASDTVDRAARIEAATRQADDRIGRMEMLLASLEDLEEESADRMLRLAGTAEDDATDTVEDTESLPSFRATRAAAQGGRN